MPPAPPERGSPPPSLHPAAEPLTRVGSLCAGGLAAGIVACGLSLILEQGADGCGALLGAPSLVALALGGLSLLVPAQRGPVALVGAWLRSGPGGVGDRSLATIGALLILLASIWPLASWVLGTFRHVGLSAALVLTLVVALVPVALAALRLLERLSLWRPAVALGGIAAFGGALAWRVATATEPGKLGPALILSSACVAALVAWLTLRNRRTAARVTLVLTVPLALYGAYAILA